MAESPEAFAIAVLHRLGIKPNRANTRALVGWTKAEGGHWNNDAKYNPLNTTQNMPGAGNTGTQGNIKVYTSWHQGIEATVKTLKNGNYGGIIQALKGNDPRAVASAIDKSPWGTHGALIYNTIGAAKPGDPNASPLVSDNVPDNAKGATAATAGGGSKLVTTSGIDKNVVLANFLQRRNPNNLLLRTGALTPGDPNVTRTTEVPLSPPASGAAASTSSKTPMAMTGNFKITGPNPGRIQPGVLNFLRKLSSVAGETIVGSDGTGHSKYTTSGNVSEHFTGNATDIPALGKHLTRLGQDALIAAGWPEAKARKITGGLYNVTQNGKRYQIIFNTLQGGNHYNHLHVGVKKL